MAVEQINPDPLQQPQSAADADYKGQPEVTKTPLDREDSSEPPSTGNGEVVKQNLGQKAWASFKTPGSALQIIFAAVIAIAIGLAVSTSVDNIPEAAPAILEIPGTLWLRALRATVLPLIVVAMIIAVQNLRNMGSGGGKLAKWTIAWYVSTTILAVVISTILVDLVWRPMFTVADEASRAVDEDTTTSQEEAGEGQAAHDIIIQVFMSFVPSNVTSAMANDELLAVLVSAIVVGALIKDKDSSIMRAVREVEKIIMKIITFLIKLAPIGVFFLILSNLFTLDINDVGQNLGVLIGASICNMAIHLFIVLPALYFGFIRKNPWSFWIKSSRAWITAWATASSAATMPVTLSVAEERGIPNSVSKFVIPLGTLLNMDGTAIYFPTILVFLAATNNQALNAGDYAVIVLLSTLSSLATTPIPSSSLVLTLIIAESVGIEITGMYAVVVAIDWLIDRFRTLLNVSGDLYASQVMAKVTKITDEFSEEFGPGAGHNASGHSADVQRMMSEAGDAQQRAPRHSKEMA